MLSSILPRLYTPRSLYCEPFVGGAAVLFAKAPEGNEIINDTNDTLITFYKEFKTNFDALYNLVQSSLYSQTLYRRAMAIYQYPEAFSPLYRAWAFYMLSHMCFGSEIGHTMSIDKTQTGRLSNRLCHSREAFSALAGRLDTVTIMNEDALRVIQQFDCEGAFFYIDPPYIGADQGHYKGYTQAMFDALLEVLEGIKGHFLLSSYPNETLKESIARKGWCSIDIAGKLPANGKGSIRRAKIEVLTANYDIG